MTDVTELIKIIVVVIIGLVGISIICYIIPHLPGWWKTRNMTVISLPDKNKVWYCKKTDTIWHIDIGQYDDRNKVKQLFKQNRYYESIDYGSDYAVNKIQPKYHDTFFRIKLKNKYEKKLADQVHTEMRNQARIKYEKEEEKMRKRLGIKKEPESKPESESIHTYINI